MDWKWISIAGGILAILFGVWKIDDRYAKCDEVSKQFVVQEKRVVETLDKFQNKLDYKFQRDRLDTVKDQTRQMKILQKKSPNDAELKEQISDLEKEREGIEKRLQELEKK